MCEKKDIMGEARCARRLLMRARRFVWLTRVTILAALLLRACISYPQARDAATEIKAAKSSLTHQRHERKQENRLAAVHKLESLPTVEAAKLLLFQGIDNSDEEVRLFFFKQKTAYEMRT